MKTFKFLSNFFFIASKDKGESKQGNANCSRFLRCTVT